MATTTTAAPVQERSLGRAVLWGAVSGLIGGLAFGMLMGMMGMLPMVGMLVGVESAVVGFFVHMLISAFIGATFGFLLEFLPVRGRVPTTIAGAGYGVIWWVLGALILMPTMLGMSEMLFVIGQTQWFSLMGHVIYGAILGIAYALLAKRA